MAKKVYIGVNSVARQVVNAFIGVSNIARKIVKGYIGVNNVAQLFYAAGAEDEELTFTSSQSWTVPSGARSVDIFCVGGGGGAGGSYRKITGRLWTSSTYQYTTSYAPSGGSGYTATQTNVLVTPGETLSIVVGAGGTGGMTYDYDRDTKNGDVTSVSDMTNGGDGGESYVARGSTKLATANGGKGGTKANVPSGSTYYGTTGVNGGNASGAGGSVAETITINASDQTTSNYYYVYCEHGDTPSRSALWGTNGTNGGNGGSVDFWYENLMNDYRNKITNNAYLGGTGQGHNTRKYGDASGTEYAAVATAVSPNTGNSGALGLSAYTDKNGSSGVVIIMVHY